MTMSRAARVTKLVIKNKKSEKTNLFAGWGVLEWRDTSKMPSLIWRDWVLVKHLDIFAIVLKILNSLCCLLIVLVGFFFYNIFSFWGECGKISFISKVSFSRLPLTNKNRSARTTTHPPSWDEFLLSLLLLLINLFAAFNTLLA